MSADRNEDLDLMTQSRYGTKQQQVDIHVPVNDMWEKRFTFIQLLVKVVTFKTGQTSYRKSLKNTYVLKTVNIL